MKGDGRRNIEKTETKDRDFLFCAVKCVSVSYAAGSDLHSYSSSLSRVH